MSLTKVSSARDTWDINGYHGIFLQMWTWKITGMLKTVKAGCLINWAPSVGSPFTSHATDEAGDQTRKWMEMVECHRHISRFGISKTEKHSDWWLQPSWKAILRALSCTMCTPRTNKLLYNPSMVYAGCIHSYTDWFIDLWLRKANCSYRLSSHLVKPIQRTWQPSPMGQLIAASDHLEGF